MSFALASTVECHLSERVGTEGILINEMFG